MCERACVNEVDLLCDASESKPAVTSTPNPPPLENTQANK